MTKTFKVVQVRGTWVVESDKRPILEASSGINLRVVIFGS